MPTQIVRKIGQRDISIETGRMARQSDGAVTIRSGDAMVFVAAVADTKPTDKDFFPLTVDYREKAAAAGKFPGGYFKREGRPTEREILTSRMIDRPLRPLFPKGFLNEVQVMSILLSADGEVDPDILAINGASTALVISDIPWNGPFGAVRVGRVNGQFVVNPTHQEVAESELDLVYVGTENEILMIEGSAKELSEEEFYRSMEFAHPFVREMIAMQRELAAQVGRPKRAVELRVPRDSVMQDARAMIGGRMLPALLTTGKQARANELKKLRDEVTTALTAKYPDVTPFEISQALEYIQKRAVRDAVVKEGKRCDGRAIDQVRPISGEVGLLPRAHGSALFQRGETQTVVLATLGSSEDVQELDSYGGGDTAKGFLLHYNFPPYSVNETRRISGPGRREIGHGALAERSILPMVPQGMDFPYAIRLTSEIMESNGSTSMASVCGGTLALMDAGVPIKAPVAGISVGLVQEPEKTVILTDIIGMEDFYGDMDFKLSGTRKGVTGVQLDLKLAGLSFGIMKDAIERARVARMHVLDEMAKILAQPRAQLSPYAPKVKVMRINPEKIGAVIGPGGKVIRKIQEETGAEISIEDSGEVRIYSTNQESGDRAIAMIEGIVAEIEVGKVYKGHVVGIKEFGCFVEVLPGKDGMVHISELANMRVNQVEDICKIGDEMVVKCIDVDDKGRVRLSRRAAMSDMDEGARQDSGGQSPSDSSRPPREGGEGRRDRGPRRDGPRHGERRGRDR